VTQYFVGEFDGVTYHSSQMDPLWMDWGVDNYASVSFSNEPSGRVIMMGWMNNWDYADRLPTNGWRGQMTLPREFGLRIVNGQLRLVSNFVHEVGKLYNNDSLQVLPNQDVLPGAVTEIPLNGTQLVHLDLEFNIANMSDGASLAVCFLNSMAQEVCFGIDKGRERPIFLNRELSGNVNFHPSFSRRITSTRQLSSDTVKFEAILDVSAIELAVDGGLEWMTALFYPDQPYDRLEVRHHDSGHPESKLTVTSGTVRGMFSMDEVSLQ
jgi:fructan beta-fructosidase